MSIEMVTFVGGSHNGKRYCLDVTRCIYDVVVTPTPDLALAPTAPTEADTPPIERYLRHTLIDGKTIFVYIGLSFGEQIAQIAAMRRSGEIV